MSSERTPLLGSGHRPSGLASSRPPLDHLDEESEALAQESQFSAIQDAAHGVDPNSSAFIPPEASHFSIHPGQSSLGRLDEENIVESSYQGGRTQREALIILGSMWIGTFLAAADGTIVATIMATVGSEFQVSKQVSWLGTSYLLTQTAFQPLYGRGADIFGRKAATLFASFVFGLGCLLCGLSQTFTQLCLARAFAGIGGGGLTTMSTILTSDVVTLKARGTYQGLGNLVFAAGAALGAPLGGLLADGRLGWRFAFLIQVPFCALHFFAVSWKVDIPAGPGSVIEKMKRIDVFGALSLVSAVTLVLTGLSLGGNQRDWNDPVVYSALIAGGILLVVFVSVEKYVAREPLMPMTVLFRRTPGFVAIACWFISISQFGIIFNVPLYFQSVEETSSSYAGLHLIPNAIVASACSLGSGLLIARWGRYKKMLLIGGFSAFIGPLAMCFWQRGVTPSFGYWLTMPWGGAGYGAILTITLVALIASVSPTEMAAATGVTYLFRATGSVLGISLSGALLQNRLQHNLEAVGLSPKTIAKIRQDVSYIKTLKGDLKEEAIAAMQSSFRVVFIGIAAAALIAFIALWPVPEHELPGKKTASAPVARREEAIAEEDEE